MNPIGTSKVYFWISVILPLLLLAGAAAWVALTWDAIPEEIPDHFDLAGQPDGWGGRGTIWINLGMGLGFYVLLLVTSFFPGPGWIVPAVMSVLILLPLARFLLRVYVLHR